MTAGAAAVAYPRWRATASAVSPASSANVACVRRNAWGGSTGTDGIARWGHIRQRAAVRSVSL